MKVDKSELSKKIDRIKSVVNKSSLKPALSGILVQDGYLIASNHELTVKAKLEGTEGESFIIPYRAFDLIKNLPEGEVEIREKHGNKIDIVADKIKNSYQSLPASQFMYTAEHISENSAGMSVDSKALKEAISHVLYAIPARGSNSIMESLYMNAASGKLDFVGLDGHVIAWVQVYFDGEFQLLIPRGAVEKLLTLEMNGDIAIEYDRKCAIFRSEEYEVHTRLVEGKYFEYRKFFVDYPKKTVVKRADLLDAMVRAKLCTEEKTPTRFEVAGTELQVSINDSSADYSETVPLQDNVDGKIVMGFNSRLVLETLKAHSEDKIQLSFGESRQPMIIASGNMKAVVLPVILRDDGLTD